jgi:hypothetical protein
MYSQDLVDTLQFKIQEFSTENDFALNTISIHFNLIYPQCMFAFVLQDPHDLLKHNIFVNSFIKINTHYSCIITNISSLFINSGINSHNMLTFLLPLADRPDDLYYEIITTIMENADLISIFCESTYSKYNNSQTYFQWMCLINSLIMMQACKEVEPNGNTVSLLKYFKLYPCKLNKLSLNKIKSEAFDVITYYKQLHPPNQQKLIDYYGRLMRTFLG